MQLKTSESNLTVSLLSWWDMDCSGNVYWNDTNGGSGAVWLPLPVNFPRVDRDPACPLGPEAP